MKTASIADMKAHLSEYIKESRNGPIIVTRHGKPTAVLLPIRDDEELERLLMAHSPRLRAMLDEAHRRIQAGEGIAEDAFWEQVEGDE